MDNVTLRPFRNEDLVRLLEIAVAAWEPVFASFRTLMGAQIFAVVFPEWRREKQAQITSACRGDHGLKVVVAVMEGKPVGFATYYLDAETGIGEIGNNAVAPLHQGRGIGTQLYAYVLDEMRSAGMDVAAVSTGGDPSHASARRAYEKVGFERAIPTVDYYLDLRQEDA